MPNPHTFTGDPKKVNIQHSTFNIQKNENLENNSSDSYQYTDRYRYYARSNELHGIKNMESTLL